MDSGNNSGTFIWVWDQQTKTKLQGSEPEWSNLQVLKFAPPPPQLENMLKMFQELLKI